MANKQPGVTLCIVNHCLRVTDSKMHEHVAERQRQGQWTIYILLRVGGEHKQRVDRQFATELAFPIHILSPADIPKLARALRGFKEREILYQNTPEMRRASRLIATALQTNSARAFDDCIALDRQQLVFSPVYSVFNRRAKKCLRRIDESLWTDTTPNKKYTMHLKGFPIANEPVTLSAQKTFADFKERVERRYETTRNAFGSLFDYDPPSSSFMSLFISSGRVSIRQLLSLTTDQHYRDELLWNQFCLLFIEHYGDDVCEAAYGPYNRRVVQKKRITWLEKPREKQLLQSLLTMSTAEPLINAIMNQLMSTGFVPNRLRMVFASWCFQQRLDWRAASGLFERFLIDYAQASNVFNWQFGYNLTLGRPHVFNIERQLKSFDREGLYIRRWHPKPEH